MVKISVCPYSYISSALKCNAIKIDYHCMIAGQKKAPTAAFIESVSQYRTFFPDTPASMVPLKLSSILHPKFDFIPVDLKNIKR